MSGSGGGSFVGGGAQEISCDRLSFDTQLSSPKSAVVAGIDIDDVLSVAIEQQGAAQVVVIKHGNQVAGGITSPKMSRLLECMRQGTQYQARVLSKVGGQVTIRISP
ncbi:hypothetical protein [Stenotrophomonas maltophilia]|uniref:hypothetical protein n=1 Tax=Stenotrophomonas maltophilia TaxID=40324 RepID=UPI002B16644E|nr:hypothetical protein [Stenotrophomonas maltophilia]HEP1209349.1 hypothetical protein [Stenotrophomonas maltophilia]